jgi:hypothetical protein
VQRALPAEKSAIFFDPLDDAPDVARGLMPRVVEFGGDRWGPGDVSLWKHPERNVTGFEAIKFEERVGQRLLARREPFEGPTTPSVKGTLAKPDLKFPPTKLLLKTRVGQILGSEAEAVGSYVIVRLALDFSELQFVFEKMPIDFRDRIPREIFRMHRRAAEYASFWIAACQYEVEDYAAAAQSFTDYVRRHPEGEWTDHARGLQARSYARTGKLAAASQSLNDLSPTDPEREGHLLLQKRVRDKREQTNAE